MRAKMRAMTTVVLALAAPLVCPQVCTTAAFAGNEIGNGGAGIEKDGKLLTFKEAGVRLSNQQLRRVPGMTLLAQILRKMPLADHSRDDLFARIEPSERREYYRIPPEDPAWAWEKVKLEKTYRELVRLNPDAQGAQSGANIVIYAKTTDGYKTYLSDEFFQLDETQQAVVLFHEMLWVSGSKHPRDLEWYHSYLGGFHPSGAYGFVVDAEMIFDQYLRRSNGEYGFDPELYEVFNRILLDNGVSLMGAAIEDHKKGRIQKFLDPKTGRLPLDVLLGSDSRTTYWEAISLLTGERGGWSNSRVPHLVIRGRSQEYTSRHLKSLVSKHPEVAYFKELLKNLKNLRFWQLRMWDFPSLAEYLNRPSIRARLDRNRVEFHPECELFDLYCSPEIARKLEIWANRHLVPSRLQFSPWSNEALDSPNGVGLPSYSFPVYIRNASGTEYLSHSFFALSFGAFVEREDRTRIHEIKKIGSNDYEDSKRSPSFQYTNFKEFWKD